MTQEDINLLEKTVLKNKDIIKAISSIDRSLDYFDCVSYLIETLDYKYYNSYNIVRKRMYNYYNKIKSDMFCKFYCIYIKNYLHERYYYMSEEEKNVISYKLDKKLKTYLINFDKFIRKNGKAESRKINSYFEKLKDKYNIDFEKEIIEYENLIQSSTLSNCDDSFTNLEDDGIFNRNLYVTQGDELNV